MDPETLQLIHDVTFVTTQRVLQPFLAFKKSNSLFFWPFLLSTGLLAVVTFAALRGSLRGGFWRDFRRSYLSARIWWHPSARADYRYYVVNAILFPVLFAPLVLSGAWVSQQVAGGLDALFGASPELTGGIWASLVYTLLFFVVYDFGRYLGHYIQHRFDVLWEFHKVHHSAEVLTPITNARAHPVDLLCMWTFPHLFTGVVHGLFAWLYAGTAGLFLYFGLHVLIFAYNLFGNLRHSHVWLSYGPHLSLLLISPAQHQIHHSTEPRHFGRNIGFALAVWDRMFGTLYVPQHQEQFVMGLGDGSEASFHGVWRMYVLPFRALWQRLRGGGGGVADTGLGRPG